MGRGGTRRYICRERDIPAAEARRYSRHGGAQERGKLRKKMEGSGEEGRERKMKTVERSRKVVMATKEGSAV